MTKRIRRPLARAATRNLDRAQAKGDRTASQHDRNARPKATPTPTDTDTDTDADADADVTARRLRGWWCAGKALSPPRLTYDGPGEAGTALLPGTS
jgi:hypothetical protein